MANKKRTLGKVVKNHKGYNIRIELKDVKITTSDRLGNEKVIGSRKGDAGTFGVYAGKRLVKGGYKTIESAVDSI